MEGRIEKIQAICKAKIEDVEEVIGSQEALIEQLKTANKNLKDENAAFQFSSNPTQPNEANLKSQNLQKTILA